MRGSIHTWSFSWKNFFFCSHTCLFDVSKEDKCTNLGNNASNFYSVSFRVCPCIGAVVSTVLVDQWNKMEGERSRSRAATTNTLSPSSFPRFEIHHQVHLSTTKYAQYTLHSVFSPGKDNSGKNKKLPISSSETCKEAQGLSPRKETTFFLLCPTTFTRCLPTQSELCLRLLSSHSLPTKEERHWYAWGGELFVQKYVFVVQNVL